MSADSDISSKDEFQTQFVTREGMYTFMPMVEYYRPNRSSYSLPSPLNPVHLSLVTLRGFRDNATKICINIGNELLVFVYRGLRNAIDQIPPFDRKTYKLINPTSHNFNSFCASTESLPLLVGFNLGIIHMVDLIKKDVSKIFNEDKIIDKTRVTCIRWVPNSKNIFLVSHASGQLYLYSDELPCGSSSPSYQLFKEGNGYGIYICKTKTSRNPLYRWVVGAEGNCVNDFAFSDCGIYLAIVSADGFLRVFHYETMELVGFARSYFGGLLCVCWSPDSKYIAVGGQDDLVTIWSLERKEVVARGQGHRSWISMVAFDPYTSTYGDTDGSGSSSSATCYRLGSVGQDTRFCLWDITEDILRQTISYADAHAASNTPNGCAFPVWQNVGKHFDNNNHVRTNLPHSSGRKLVPRKDNNNSHRKTIQRSESGSINKCLPKDDPLLLIGTAACPRFDQCTVLTPLINKKVSRERLSSLVFKEECILTCCYDGTISTWARPAYNFADQSYSDRCNGYINELVQITSRIADNQI